MLSYLLYIFFAYNQIEIDKKSRNLTSFMIPLGFMKMTTLF